MRDAEWGRIRCSRVLEDMFVLQGDDDVKGGARIEVEGWLLSRWNSVLSMIDLGESCDMRKAGLLRGYSFATYWIPSPWAARAARSSSMCNCLRLSDKISWTYGTLGPGRKAERAA